MNSYCIMGIITVVIIICAYFIDKNNSIKHIDKIATTSLSIISLFTAVYTAIKNVAMPQKKDEQEEVETEEIDETKDKD